MGSIIHMETEEVDQTARQMLYGVTDLLSILENLSHQSRRLRSNWQGGRSERVLSRLDRSIREMRREAEKMDDLSRAARREVDQWQEADKTPFNLKKYLMKDWQGVLTDIAKIGVAGSFVAFLRTSPKLPGEVIFKAPPIFGKIGKVVGAVFGKDAGLAFGGQSLRKFIGLNPKTNHILPTNLPKAMLLANIAIDVVPQLIDDFKEYGLTQRFAAAAIVDAIVKAALAAGGAYLAFAAATFVVGLLPVAAPAILVGGVALLTCVGVGIILDRLKAVAWDWFLNSGLRDEAIEGINRAINSVKNYMTNAIQAGADRVKSAFSSFIKSLTAQPGGAYAV